jgi:hypothetical protein
MRIVHRTFLAGAVVLLATTAGAQNTPPPFGHWEGTISAPFGEVGIQIDLGRNDGGQLIAAYSRPDTGINGLPLANVAVDGDSATFEIKANGGGTFTGTFTATAMSGTFTTPIGAVPFSMMRTGEGRFAAPPRSPAISPALEGSWQGALAVGDNRLRLAMTLKNNPDGTSTGAIVSIDEGGLDIPVRIRQEARRVTIEVPATGGVFSGDLNADSSSIAGSYSERTPALPLTFERVR